MELTRTQLLQARQERDVVKLKLDEFNLSLYGDSGPVDKGAGPDYRAPVDSDTDYGDAVDRSDEIESDIELDDRGYLDVEPDKSESDERESDGGGYLDVEPDEHKSDGGGYLDVKPGPNERKKKFRKTKAKAADTEAGEGDYENPRWPGARRKKGPDGDGRLPPNNDSAYPDTDPGGYVTFSGGEGSSGDETDVEDPH